MISIVSGSLAIQPATTRAQNAVPINTMFNWHSIQQQTKDFVLNGLAWSVAKVLVQQLTASIVNWINTGFDGSPAFLTNPQGFFLNIADDITGEFISQSGALQNLCSPWNIDIRLAIGLGQTQSLRKKYACTLNTIIGNAKNATVNGYSIEGFTSGDFRQGGWPAFISLTTEPQNNLYGTYLQAKSDLEGQILGKQNAVNNDLNRGNGFLSSEKCQPRINPTTGKALTANDLGLNQSDLAQLNATGKTSAGSGTQYRANKDPESGVIIYESCSVQTPGSVISSALTKNLDSGREQLLLADSINEITSALFAQLITQVLTKGLGASVQRTSGTTRSYVDQLYLETKSPTAFKGSGDNIQGSYAPYMADAQKVESIYAQAVAAFDIVKSDYSNAQGCFQDINVNSHPGGDRNTADQKLLEIQNILLTQVPAEIAVYKSKLDRATQTVDAINSNISSAGNISGAEDVSYQANELQNFINTNVPQIQSDLNTAPTDLTAAQAKAAQMDVVAKRYYADCQQLKNGFGFRQ